MAALSQFSSPKKFLPIKRVDGEPLTRNDLQFDLLDTIFSDTRAVFTDPNPTLNGDPPGTKVTFRDLYVNYLVRSAKASKVLKDKMMEAPDFGTDFAKLALLTNVGRVNTTMAFFPEMKTVIRTYHPVPSLQRTDGNLQDAPRIKSILKAIILESEDKGNGAPSTPLDVLSRSRSGQHPSTSLTNLVFVMASHSVPLAQLHFTEAIDFQDIFMPCSFSSASRARAFLWLCYHYLEEGAVGAEGDYDSGSDPTNPFGDSFSARYPGKVPALEVLTEEELALENVDSEEEKALGEKLATARKEFQAKREAKETKDEATKGQGRRIEKEVVVDVGDGSTKSKAELAKERKAQSDKARRARQKELKNQAKSQPVAVISDSEIIGVFDLPTPSLVTPSVSRKVSSTEGTPQSRSHASRPSPNVSSLRRNSPQTPSHRYTPYKLPSASAVKIKHNTSRHANTSTAALQISPRKHSKEFARKSMLQHAWQVITSSDPLLDSDDELADEDVRFDYIDRLSVVARLRGKSFGQSPAQATYMDVDQEVVASSPMTPSSNDRRRSL